MSVFSRSVACVLVLASLTAGADAGDAALPDAFAWRGTLALPAGASLVRVDVPVQALMQLQSSSAHDLRVFNAAGAVVPYVLLGRTELSHASPVAQTQAYPAYPLFAANSGKPLRGAVQVQVDGGGNHSSAWVRWDNTASETSADTTAPPLQAALFDLRGEQQMLDALHLNLELPHNALVPVMVSSSADLKDWTVVATKGPVFQFDGLDAPSNATLELRQPLSVKGRYLRLTWAGQSGVKMVSLTGRVAATQTMPELLRAPGGQGKRPGTGRQKRHLQRRELHGGLQTALGQGLALAGLHSQRAHRGAMQRRGRVTGAVSHRVQAVHHGRRQRAPRLCGLIATQDAHRQ